MYQFFIDLKKAMEQYCSSHEDVLEWLLEAEDRLNSMEKVSDRLDEIKIQFQINSDYMQYLDTNQEAVGKVRLYVVEVFGRGSFNVIFATKVYVPTTITFFF